MKVVDKQKYPLVIGRITKVIQLISKQNLVGLAQHLKQSEFKASLLLKMSEKPLEFLPKAEAQFCEQRDSLLKQQFARKYLAPVIDKSSIASMKIKRLKTMDEFGDEEDEQDLPTEALIKRKPKGVSEAEKVKNTEKVPEQDLINVDEVPGEHFIYYRVWKGVLKGENAGQKIRVGGELHSCGAEDFTRCFSKPPSTIVLNSRIPRREFDTTLHNALVADQS